MIQEKRIGFWGDQPHEQPIHYILDWGVKEFIQCLEVKEDEATVKHYKGHAKCRICNKSIGNKEYRLDDATQPYIWIWPEGFKHYIRVHHISPDYLFWCYVLGKKPVPLYSYSPPKKRFSFILRKTHGRQ